MWSATCDDGRRDLLERVPPLVHRHAQRVGVVGVLGAERAHLRERRAIQRRSFGRDERRHERHHHDRVRLANQLEHVVGDVARDVAERASGRVGEDHRRLAHLDRLSHRVVGDMAEVDQHAGAVQLADDLLAERRESAVRMLARGRVRPVRVVVVGERHVAGAETSQDAQGAEGVPDRMASLNPDHRRDPALGSDLPDVGCRACLLEPARIPMHQSVEPLDLLERLRDRLIGRQV